MQIALQPWNASEPQERISVANGRRWPTFNFGPRTELTELRPRHLLMVEEYRFVQHGYDRDALGEFFLANWYPLFGPLRRSKALEVSSDQFRKELMVSRLLDLIEMRRDEYDEERAHHHWDIN
jgi:hypothetical protein